MPQNPFGDEWGPQVRRWRGVPLPAEQAMSGLEDIEMPVPPQSPIKSQELPMFEPPVEATQQAPRTRFNPIDNPGQQPPGGTGNPLSGLLSWGPATTMSQMGGAGRPAGMSQPGRGAPQETLEMPTPPPSPVASRAMKVPQYSDVETMVKQGPGGPQGGADINQRADAIINDPTRSPMGGGARSAPPEAMAGLQSAGRMSSAEPVGFTFGPESAKPAPMPTSQEALATLTGGVGGQVGGQRMSPELEQFQQLLNMRRPGMARRDEDIINQQIAQEMGSATARSGELEAFRQKQRSQGLEEEKLRQPFAMKKYETETVPASTKYAQEQAMARQAAQAAARKAELEAAQGYKQSALQKVLDTSGGRKIQSYNPTSEAITFAPEKGVPNPITQDITRARGVWETRQDDESAGQFTQAALGALPHLRLNPEDNEIVTNALGRSGIIKPFEEAFDLSEATEDEAAHFYQIWTQLGGR